MSADSDSDLSSSSSSDSDDEQRHADRQSVSCSARPASVGHPSTSRGVRPRSSHVHCRLLLCRVAGCVDFQCDDGIKGLCAAHSILRLPTSGTLPRPLAAHKRQLAATVSRAALSTSKPSNSSLFLSTSGSAHTAAAPLSPARHRRHKTYSSAPRSRSRAQQQESGWKLPPFGVRPMTVETLKAEGYEPFSQPAQQRQRRRSSRLSSSSPSAAEPVFEPRALASTPSRALRTPAGLTLERSAKVPAAPRPNTAAARFVSCPAAAAARAQTAAAALPASAFASSSSLSPPPPPSSSSLLLPSSPPARPPSPLSPPAACSSSSVSCSSPIIISPALPPKRLKPLTPVEEQRLYRADLLSRLLQRPPVAALPSSLLRLVDRLLARRPPVRVLKSRQLLLSPQDDAERRRRRAEMKAKLALWLQRRAREDALVRRNVLRGASVKHRSQGLEGWMRSRLSSKREMVMGMWRPTETKAQPDCGG